MSESADLTTELADAHTAYDEAAERVADHGERDLKRVAAAHDRATTLLDKYEERATGTGDFEGFIEFQEAFATFVERLDDDLPRHEAFETANQRVDKRRLSGSDFVAARNALSPAGDLTELLADRDATHERYRDVRRRVVAHRNHLTGRIADLEHLVDLGEADLDAPVGDLRTPIETYNDHVTDAFASFTHDESLREVLGFVAKTRQFPLVPFRAPPDDLREYVETSPVGAEPLPRVLDYAEYSRSKLSHYVDAPRELERNVAVHRSYLVGLDAEPLVISWPPPPADELRFRVGELVSVVGRFAPDETVAALREVCSFARDETYERLQRAAAAYGELTDRERTRLAEGDVDADLDRARAERERLEDALVTHPAP